MATVRPTTGEEHRAEPRDLRTSELLRRAASELAHDSAEQPTGPNRSELAKELQVRALWIERSRADEAVSDERRRGVAAIEDAGDDLGVSPTSVVLRCKGGEQCSFHRDGGATEDPCPGQCDAPGCTLDGHYEVGTDRVVCAVHGAIVLLARAISEALAVDNAHDAPAGR